MATHSCGLTPAQVEKEWKIHQASPCQISLTVPLPTRSLPSDKRRAVFLNIGANIPAAFRDLAGLVPCQAIKSRGWALFQSRSLPILTPLQCFSSDAERFCRCRLILSEQKGGER
jgi:hypothetical protein